MTKQVTVPEALQRIVYGEDQSKKDFGDAWADTVMHIYESGIDSLPEVPLEKHGEFTRALFELKRMVNRDLGLDHAPQT